MKKTSVFEGLASNYDSTALTFPQLNVDAVKKKLHLKEEALKRAASEQPASSATFFDDVEQKIVSFVDKHVESAAENYFDHIRSFEERINRLSAMGHSGSIDNIAMTAEGDFDALVRRDTIRLYEAKLAVTESEQNLHSFKAENGLERAAHYPESRFFYYALATLLIAFETGLNGMFFAQGHELGLLGGGFTAFVPALLNVAAGLCLGNFALRAAIHKKKLKKFTGLFFCLLIPASVFILNLLIAHYRSAMMSVTDLEVVDPAKTALETFIAAPFMLRDVESWLLLATGCFCSLMATFDFWKMDDAYPHFGEVTRAHNARLTAYSRLTEDSLNELTDLRDRNLEELDRASNLLNAKVNEANMIVDSQNRWKLVYANYLNHLENAGQQMLSFYRSHNQGARKTAVPAYFQEQWSLNKPPLPETGLDFIKVLSDFKAESAGIKDIYSSCVNRIGQAFKKSLHEYQTIEQLKPDELKQWRKTSVIAADIDNLSVAA